VLAASISKPVPAGFNTSFGGKGLVEEIVAASPKPDLEMFGAIFASGLENPVRIARPPPSKRPSVPEAFGFFSSDIGHLRSELLSSTILHVVFYCQVY